MASTAAISAGLNPLFAAISGENLYKDKTKILKIDKSVTLVDENIQHHIVQQAKFASAREDRHPRGR